MDRRQFLASSLVTGAISSSAVPASASNTARASAGENISSPAEMVGDDRAYMVDLLAKMAMPILGPMSQGKLRSVFKPELSPTWDGRSVDVAYLEAFGRLMSGIAPWLALPDDMSVEGKLRQLLRHQALASIEHSVNPKSPDLLVWTGVQQLLVDSSYYTNALIRAPKALWDPLDKITKRRIIQVIKGTREIQANQSNWLLFSAMNEAFLISIGEPHDSEKLNCAIRKFREWYLGDGWYGDGPNMHFDYYNSYVIHPMLVEILEVLAAHGVKADGADAAEELVKANQRMQRYGEHLERLIAPDGSFATIGRSLTYRTAAFQPLGLLALRKTLPASLPEGQVRPATMAEQRAIFRFPSNFDAQGYLTLGFTGHMPQLADYYSNAGSMYITSESLLALGLPATDSYWTAPTLDWTSKKAFSGQAFPKDYYSPV